jgi:hypothetical protein
MIDMGPQDATGHTRSAGPAVIDAARRMLSDFSRCPSCAAVLQGNRCPDCGVDLTGAQARKVMELSVRAEQVLAERESVLRAMRELVRTPPKPAPSVAAQPPGEQPPIEQPPSAPLPPKPPQVDAVRRRELDVHGVLVGLGALLLSVAAVGFLVFSWRVLTLPGRAAVIAVATLGVLATASWLRGRLPETAEAVGGLGVVLVLADCWAIRRTGLFGADQPQGLGYAAAAAAICAVLLGGWALLSGVRAGSLAAVTLAPLAVLLLAARLDGDLGPVPVFATGFLLVAGMALGRELLPVGWQLERWLLRASAAGALIGAGGQAGVGLPGHGRAALVLVVAAQVAAAEALADRSTALLLRRAWSFGAGLLAGAAAVQASLPLVEVLDLDGVIRLLPLTALPALAVAAAAALPRVPGAAIRRTAIGAGTVLIAAVAAVPVINLAGWLPIRAALVGVHAWSAEPGNRLADLDPQPAATSAAWAVTLLGLIVISACALLAARISGWPAWLRRPVRFTSVAAAGGAVVVLPLLPTAPVVAVVAALAGCSVMLAVALVAGPTAVVLDGRPRSWRVAGWTASALTGIVAVLLAWSCRELSVPLTALGIVGLLLARRRISASPGSRLVGGIPALLAGLAAAAAPFAVAASAGIAGAPEHLRVIWAGLIGGLSVAGLLGLPRWMPPARSGRASWTGVDRFAAAIPGLFAVIVGLLATVPSGPVPAVDGVAWPRPALLAVALLIAVTGACAVRPAIAQALPVLAPFCAAAIAPLLGGLAAALRAAAPASSTWPSWSLLWAAAATVTALVITAVVLSGRADPQRRKAAEIGALLTGLIGILLVSGPTELWPSLLVLGAGAAAIAATPNRQRIGWLAGVLLTGSTWTRLDLGNVTLVEAYSLPPALALLALALYRIHRDHTTEPGPALIPVATVGLAPSIVVAAGGSALRPMALLMIAAVLVAAGWLLQRGGRPGSGFETALGAALAGVGVFTAAGTAVVRVGARLSAEADSILPGATQVPPSRIELWTLPAALILVLAALVIRTAQVRPVLSEVQLPSRLDRPAEALRLAASPPILVALLLAGVPTLLAALLAVEGTKVDDRWSVLRVAAVLGVSALAALVALATRSGSDRFRPTRRGLEPGAVALAVVASWAGLRLDTGLVEVWTLPLAVLLLIQGWFRFEQLAADDARPGGLVPSWAAYAPGLAVLLLPSLYLGVYTADGSALREIGLITLAGATLVAGAKDRLQAPILIGAGVLAVQAVVLLAPWFAEVQEAVPLWGWLAAVGLGLILFGARYEARMQQLRTLRLRLAALR